MQVRVGCEFRYEATWETPAVMQVQPRRDAEPRILSEEWQLTPSLASDSFTDLYHNACRRMVLPAGEQIIRYDALVEVSDEKDDVDLSAQEMRIEAMPGEVLHFTLPSRYCLSDVLSDMAWQLFGSITPGYGRVQAICDWVHNNIRFQYGTSNPLTTAADVCAQGVGVCRDFAHLAVTFCRALNIPARYVFGYLPDIGVPPPDAPMDFCAWMEVYLGGRWFTFDPRNNEPRIGRVLVGRGRDALDVAMVTTFGSPRLAQMTVWADEVSPDGQMQEAS
ncbi:MAG TPA: transglutaminase family protein [Ktedonobacteraceae bacterium]|nr:transglutaminase family protein [Ktedonobacteraceae bacterium]